MQVSNRRNSESCAYSKLHEKGAIFVKYEWQIRNTSTIYLQQNNEPYNSIGSFIICAWSETKIGTQKMAENTKCPRPKATALPIFQNRSNRKSSRFLSVHLLHFNCALAHYGDKFLTRSPIRPKTETDYALALGYRPCFSVFRWLSTPAVTWSSHINVDAMGNHMYGAWLMAWHDRAQHIKTFVFANSPVYTSLFLDQIFPICSHCRRLLGCWFFLFFFFFYLDHSSSVLCFFLRLSSTLRRRRSLSSPSCSRLYFSFSHSKWHVVCVKCK